MSRPLWSVGGEVEYAAGADKALHVFDRVSHLFLVSARLLDRLFEYHERIIGVAAEGADVFLEFGLVILFVFEQDRLLLDCSSEARLRRAACLQGR